MIEVVIVAMKPSSKKLRALIAARGRAGQCIRCGCECLNAEKRIKRRYGCCRKCYEIFRSEYIRLSLDRGKQERFKAREINLGHILPFRGGQRIDQQEVA